MSEPQSARMELIRGLHNLREVHRGCVLTIGNFDGVHQGHQLLIQRMKAFSEDLQLPSAVLTFEPTPREYFAPAQAAPRIYTLRDKLDALAALQVQRVIIVRFCRDLAAWSPEQFVQGLLVQGLGAKAVVVGDDFRFGHQRSGDAALLRRYGAIHDFAVASCSSVLIDGERCSSTAIRNALSQADLASANRMLGRPYRISGRVRHGLKLGRKLGMPTANLSFRRRLALRYGVYAVTIRCRDALWTGVASYGIRPTLGGTHWLLEAHAFAACGDLYGQKIEVEFRHFLRAEQRFDSLNALAEQMQHDADAAKRLLQ